MQPNSPSSSSSQPHTAPAQPDLFTQSTAHGPQQQQQFPTSPRQDAAHSTSILTSEPPTHLPSSPLSFLSGGELPHSPSSIHHPAHFDDSEENATYAYDEDQDSGYTGQHASIVTASAILSRSGAVFPFPVNYPPTPRAHATARRPSVGRYSTHRSSTSRSRTESLDDVLFSNSGDGVYEQGERGMRRDSTSSHSSMSSAAALPSEMHSPLPLNFAQQSSAGPTSSRQASLANRGFSPFLQNQPGSTWLPPLDIGGHSVPSRKNGLDPPNGVSSTSVEDRPRASKAERKRPRPRQRASNGSALEALGTLLLHSREAKGRPSVLSFARPEEGVPLSEDEAGLPFQRGGDADVDADDDEEAGGVRGKRSRESTHASSEYEPVTPLFHAPSSFLFGNASRRVRSGSVRSERSSASVSRDHLPASSAGGASSALSPFAADDDPDDRAQWFRRFFGPASAKFQPQHAEQQQQQERQKQQSSTLPFGLRFPTMHNSSLLTAKGRSDTLTIAERRARRFLLGPRADESGGQTDPSFRLVWTRRNQPSFQVEREQPPQTQTQSTRPVVSSRNKESADDSVLTPTLRSPPFRRTQSEMPTTRVGSGGPRPSFPRACDEPEPVPASFLHRRRRGHGHGHGKTGGGGGGGDHQMVRDDSPFPAASLGGILGPSSNMDLPEPPPSPLAMPGGWVGSASYRRSGRRAWLWWEGKGDESPVPSSSSFDSPRFGGAGSGSRGLVRNASTGSTGSPRTSVSRKMPPLARASTSLRSSSHSNPTKRRSNHLYEEGALWLPPPLLDDAGSSPSSFEGLLGIKRMREREQARKQLERLRARNRPTSQPGLITALGNFVKAAHAAELSHKKMRRADVVDVEVEKRRKRPGMGMLGGAGAGAWRSLSAFELGQKKVGAVLGGRPAAMDILEETEKTNAVLEEGSELEEEDAEVEEVGEEEEEEEQPGSRLWWDRLFSKSRAASGAVWAMGMGAGQTSEARPSMADRSRTEPAFKRRSVEIQDEDAHEEDEDAEIPPAEGADMSSSSSFHLDSTPPPSSAPRRKMTGNTTTSSSISAAAPPPPSFTSHTLSTLTEDQGTDFSAEFAISAASASVSASSGASPRLSGESARSSSSGSGSGTGSGTYLSSRMNSPMREFPHAPRLVPIHISSPSSPMTPLISDVLDPFLPNGTEGRKRSGSGSFVEFGRSPSGSGPAPRAPKLAPTLMSQPPSPWTGTGGMEFGFGSKPRLGPTLMSQPPSPWTGTELGSGLEVGGWTPTGGMGMGVGAKRRSFSSLSPVMRMDALREVEPDDPPASPLQQRQQISFRLNAELVRPSPQDGASSGLSSISPRLVPRKLEVIASLLLRASQHVEAFVDDDDELDGQGQGRRGLGIATATSMASSEVGIKRRGGGQKHGMEGKDRLGMKSEILRGAGLGLASEARLTPTALFLSQPVSATGESTTPNGVPPPSFSSASANKLRVPAASGPSRASSNRSHSHSSMASRMARRQPRRSFFLWLLIGDLFLGPSPSLGSNSTDSSQTPSVLGPIASVLTHLIGFTVFVLAHVLDLATNVWENTTRLVWFVRWVGLNLSGRTVLGRCVWEVYLLVRDEWNTVAEEDHEDRAGRRRRRRKGGRGRRGSWSGSAAAGEEEEEEEDGLDLDPMDSAAPAAAVQGKGTKRTEPKGLSGWQIIRGLTELACLQAVTRERYLAEGAGLEKLRGWKKRRRGDEGVGEKSDAGAYSNTSAITYLSLDRASSEESGEEGSEGGHHHHHHRRRSSRSYRPGDDSGSTQTQTQTQLEQEHSPLDSLSISSDDDSDDSDESEDEMIVTRQDADVLEFSKTPRPITLGEGGAATTSSSYFHLNPHSSPPPMNMNTNANAASRQQQQQQMRWNAPLGFGMTPLPPPLSASGDVYALPTSRTVAEEGEGEGAGGRGARGRRGSVVNQGRKHGALWSDAPRDLVKTMRWASRMAISAYGLHVHIVDLPPTFTPSGNRFNRQTFAHLSRLNPDDVLHAEIQTLDSEAAYQPTFYIVRDFVRKVVVVSVRGTQSFSDIIVDLDVNVETVGLPALKQGQGQGGEEGDGDGEWVRDPRLKAHAGIWRAAQSLIKPGSSLFDTLKTTMEELCDFGLVLTGHSLGAAIASAVALLISEYKPVEGTNSNSNSMEQEGRGMWVTRSGTGLPAGRAIRTIAFANPATVSAALADRAALGIIPLVTTVVLGSDVIPRAGHGQARELRRVLGALSRVRRRHAFQGEEGEEDARVHIVRSWWDWRSICAAAAEAEGVEDPDPDSSRSRRGEDQEKVRAPISAVGEMMGRSKRLSLAGLDAVTLDRKERIEEQLWKLRCDVEADLYAAVKERMRMAGGAEAGLRTPGLSPWVGPTTGGPSGTRPGTPLHKLASRRQKLDMATLASEVREEERAEGGRVMLLPAGRSLLIESGEIYVVRSPLSFFSLPDLTPKMLGDHLPSAYEAAMEEDLAA